MKQKAFRKELETIINRYSMENGSDTPDFILAVYLAECLIAFDKATARRDEWYGLKRGIPSMRSIGAEVDTEAPSTIVPRHPVGEE